MPRSPRNWMSAHDPIEKAALKAVEAFGGKAIVMHISRKKLVVRADNGVKIKVYWRP